MPDTDARWSSALAEYDEVVSGFCRLATTFDATTWRQPPIAGKWSPAAVSLHVCQAYEFGRDAVENGSEMKPLVSPAIAWLSRSLLLPWFLKTKQFPRGARAPAEVLPDLAEAERCTPASLVERLRQSSRDAAESLRRADVERPSVRIAHAYFGALTPLLALRLLSTHTRHHARALGAG